jgi:hypothetical protein
MSAVAQPDLDQAPGMTRDLRRGALTQKYGITIDEGKTGVLPEASHSE